jgi:hypothetical protein
VTICRQAWMNVFGGGNNSPDFRSIRNPEA